MIPSEKDKSEWYFSYKYQMRSIIGMPSSDIGNTGRFCLPFTFLSTKAIGIIVILSVPDIYVFIRT
jgi:hypothetical protein